MKDMEMLHDLIMESREHLEKIEPDLLELEKKGADVSDELINRIFRAVHSIKGGFSFFGLEKVVILAHAMENIIAGIREKKITLIPAVSEALLMGIDKLRTLLDDINNIDNISIEQEVAAFEPFINHTEAGDEQNESLMSFEEIRQLHPIFNQEHMVDAVKNGRQIYQILLNLVVDLSEKHMSALDLFTSWEKFGIILDSTLPLNLTETVNLDTVEKETASVLFSTVLEPDLIGQALDIPAEQIFTVDLSHIRRKLSEGKKDDAGSTPERQRLEPLQGDAKGYRKIEDALRVKVSLLNNLMNFAGELVLARNQLLQSMNIRLVDCVQIQNIFTDFQNQLRQSLLKLLTQKPADRDNIHQVIEGELTRLDHAFKSVLNLKLSECNGIGGIVQNIDMVTTVLQENIMQTRMQPISIVFNKFPRFIRDLGKKLKKEITLLQIGQDVELDKSIIELLSDPLTHLIRNAADHGIELPEDRNFTGKEPKGVIELRAYQEGGKVIIEIEDDGVGINSDVIKQSALEKGIITKEKAEMMSAKELQMLIFVPGFSTATRVSDISGRGVGMDVVKTNIERLGGTVEIESTVGKGTKVTMKLPLTLAIIPSLIIKSEGRSFAVPQVGLEEIVRIRANDITRKIECVHNSEVLRLRGKLLPLIRLPDVLGIETTYVHPETGERLPDNRSRWSDRRKNNQAPEQAADPATTRREGEERLKTKDRRTGISNAIKIVVLRLESKHYGIVVDDVQDSEEIVVKPLPDYIMRTSQCYAGATIMGDGKVAMILDTNGIAIRGKLQFEQIEKQQAIEKMKATQREQQKNIENLLLFSLGSQEHFAIDVMSIARIEKRAVSEIQCIGTKEFVNYDNTSLRLFRIENYLPVQHPSKEHDTLYIIVPKNIKHSFGIISARVEDTMQIDLKLDKEFIKGNGIKGTAILNEKMTIVLNVPDLISMFEHEFAQ